MPLPLEKQTVSSPEKVTAPESTNSAPPKSEPCAPAAEPIAPARDVINVATPASKDVGRPCGYTEELAERICADIAGGGNLETICGKDDIPARSTVNRWMHKYPEFRASIELAMQQRAFMRIDKIDVAAADAKDDFTEVPIEGGLTDRVENTRAVGRSKLYIDTQFRLMAKENPRFSDRPTIVMPDPQGGTGTARLINPPNRQMIEHDPLEQSLAAWRNRGVPVPVAK